MSGNVEEFGPVAVIAIFGQHDSLNVTCSTHRIDFDAHFEVVSQCNNLQMVSVDIELFNLSDAESSYVASTEGLVHYRILLQIARGQPANIHD